MVVTWAAKDPEEVLDYGINWNDQANPRLAEGDTISTSAWSIASGGDDLEIDSDGNDETTTTVWLSGGALNRTYELTNTITTAQGRTHQETAILPVRSK